MTHATAYSRFVRVLNQARRLNLEAAGQPAPVLQSPGRRRFIKNTAIGGVALTGVGGLGGCFAARREVVIVGGGLAGLNAAYQLGKAGIRAQVYEARNRVGGRMHTVTGVVGDGIVTDLGAELVNTDHDDMMELIGEFGLGVTSRIEPNEELDKIGFYFAGSRRSEAEMADALRAFAGQLMIDAELLDADWDTWAPVFDNQSLAEYLDQHSDKLPADPDIRLLMESLVRVEYGVEPQDSSVLQLLYLLPVVDGEHVELLSTSDEAYVINGGSESLIKSLRNVLGNQIHTGKALTSIARDRRGYTLMFNGTQKITAQYVILALPFTALRQVDLQVDLPESLTRFITEADLGRNEKIIAGFNQRVWRTEGGFEIEAWTDKSVSLVWDASLRQLQQPNGALTFFLGGNQVAETASGTPQDQGQHLLQEYDPLLPGLQDNANGKFIRTAWHKTPGIGGGYTNFKPGQYTGFAEEWLYIEADDPEEAQNFHVDRLVFAGEHTSDEYYGFMNGAAQTGRLAAQWILQDLQSDTDAGAELANAEMENTEVTAIV